MDLIVSIDIGSSGVRASAYTIKGKLISFGKQTYKTYYDKPGWAEQDPNDWKMATRISLKKMVENLKLPYKIMGIGLTGQCPTYVPVDKNINPVGRAFIYQDNRAVNETFELEKKYGSRLIHDITGHRLLAFYILPKILWQRANQPCLFKNIAYILQPRDYIAYYLTGQIATDETHANATLLYELKQHRWNKKLMTELNLDTNIFPNKVLMPWQIVGELRKSIAESVGLTSGIPIVIGAADSQCCCLGVGAVRPEILSEMSGTSPCLNSTVLNPVNDINIGNYTHVIPNAWCTEIGLNATGANLEWLTNILYKKDSNRYNLLKENIKKIKVGADGLIFIPYLTGGERDNPLLKGGFYNLNLYHNAGDMAKAVLEGVAFAIRERIERLSKSTCSFKSIYISGGGALLDEWNEIKTNIFGVPVYAIKDVDGAELGAAMLAGIGSGVFKDYQEAIKNCVCDGKEFLPNLKIHATYNELYEMFLEVEDKFVSNKSLA
ncbi:FGGY family carbohydrate kinase [Thermoanaerobacterium sp. RBIITD]|uniref:xylulokinase n=1 Tax=Thermoanaerobacterium sp. RBIITD TaxID=1550240 RepID=UPI000BB88679|nr:FGGY family carbohydrate kinase [Thermoanaerobacterium sp. RBIITD]SNX54670.1 xylulokinase [Thermoanaerobacterium sp. RBIITD]